MTIFNSRAIIYTLYFNLYTKKNLYTEENLYTKKKSLYSNENKMALIIPVRGFTPEIGPDTFLAENATVVGDVVMGSECSVWFNTVIRGDVNSIRIGNRVNIQDGSVLHTLYKKSTIEIGDDVSIGHNVTIHGAKIHNYALI